MVGLFGFGGAGGGVGGFGGAAEGGGVLQEEGRRVSEGVCGWGIWG